MTKQKIEKWKQIRKQGPLRYVLLRGVLCCGLPMLVVTAALMRYNGISLGFASLSLLLVAACGAALGIAMWAVQERLFRNAIKAA